MDSAKLDLKIFAREGASVAPEELVPIFHRWIRDSRLDDLLVDVADYAHVPGGPGVVLIAHEAHYALDQADGRPGLLYSRRRERGVGGGAAPGPDDRLRSVFAAALAACRALEEEPELRGRLAFRGDRLLLTVNDRLASADRGAAEAELRARLEPLLATLYPGSTWEIDAPGGPAERLSLAVEASGSPDAATLLARLGGTRAGGGEA